MKTVQILLFAFSFCFFSIAATAQTSSHAIKVSGECGMCKSKIEKAAKSAGASYASWDVDSKMLTVKYKNSSTNLAKIEKSVAGVGYDTQNVKATDAAYDKLHGCCKYDRAKAKDAAHACCDSEKCTASQCMKDGQCSGNMACCKDSGCSEKACCKKDHQ